MKLVTTYAALQILGPEYQWKTEFYLDGRLKNGALFGNLAVKGYGDPYLVEETYEENKLSLVLFSIKADKLSELLKGIQYVSSQKDESDIFRIEMTLPFRPIWGWDIRFSEGKMEWVVRKAPIVEERNLLDGIKICLDAGHNPGSGAVGPTRLEEKNINWIISNKLRLALKKEGAQIVMTRPRKNDKASLRNRVKIANRKNCRFFISVHNNSVSNGKDPFKKCGTETYYYTPYSRILAG